MKKGFAYVAVLFLLAILLAAAFYFAGTVVHWRKITRADFYGIQAQAMAENAAAYFQNKQPVLLKNQVAKIERDTLFILEGFDSVLEEQGFRIVQNKNTLYFIGYAGQLPEPQAVKILYTVTGGQPEPWYE